MGVTWWIEEGGRGARGSQGCAVQSELAQMPCGVTVV